MIKINITSNKKYLYQESLNMIYWEGYGTIFMLFLPKTYTLLPNIREYPTQTGNIVQSNCSIFLSGLAEVIKNKEKSRHCYKLKGDYGETKTVLHTGWNKQVRGKVGTLIGSWNRRRTLVGKLVKFE